MEDEACWICLEGPQREPLARPCQCPRDVHLRCLSRWCLQQAGRSEERLCRFCKTELPDWKSVLTGPSLPPADPIMVVTLGNVVHKIRVKPGEEGQREFQQEIRRLFNIPDGVDFEVTFRCKAPCTSETIQLEGMSSYHAATHCASLMAAQRLAATGPSQGGSSGGQAADAAPVPLPATRSTRTSDSGRSSLATRTSRLGAVAAVAAGATAGAMRRLTTSVQSAMQALQGSNSNTNADRHTPPAGSPAPALNPTAFAPLPLPANTSPSPPLSSSPATATPHTTSKRPAPQHTLGSARPPTPAPFQLTSPATSQHSSPAVGSGSGNGISGSGSGSGSGVTPMECGEDLVFTSEDEDEVVEGLAVRSRGAGSTPWEQQAAAQRVVATRTSMQCSPRESTRLRRSQRLQGGAEDAGLVRSWPADTAPGSAGNADGGVSLPPARMTTARRAARLLPGQHQSLHAPLLPEVDQSSCGSQGRVLLAASSTGSGRLDEGDSMMGVEEAAGSHVEGAEKVRPAKTSFFSHLRRSPRTRTTFSNLNSSLRR